MPVRQVGKDCYQWGNQKKYCGPDAKKKAILQGIAIYNTGWREAEGVNTHSVTISRSSNPKKKLMAVFTDSEGNKIKTTHFGQRGASDYTKHGDKERMKRYLERHGGGTTTSTKEDWEDPTTAGALSRWILWNKPSLSSSFADYKRRFGLKGGIDGKAAESEKFGASSRKTLSPITRRGYWRKSPMVPIFCGMLFAAFTFRNR